MALEHQKNYLKKSWKKSRHNIFSKTCRKTIDKIYAFFKKQESLYFLKNTIYNKQCFHRKCRRSSLVEHQLPKLRRRVRFPSPASLKPRSYAVFCIFRHPSPHSRRPRRSALPRWSLQRAHPAPIPGVRHRCG